MSDDNGKHILSIEEMLMADDIEYRTIASWKYKNAKGELEQGYVRIGSLTAEQVADWRDTIDGPAKKTMGIRLLVASLVDEHGKRIGMPNHAAQFRSKSNAVQERILAEIIELNGLSVKKADAEQAKNA